MYYTTARNRRVQLELLESKIAHKRGVRSISVPRRRKVSSMVEKAARSHFGFVARPSLAAAATPKPPPAVFREAHSGLLRVAAREIVLRFKTRVRASTRRKIFAKHRLCVRSRNPFRRYQWLVYVDARPDGETLLEIANDLAEMDEVVFATPNFVSEYRRSALPSIPLAQWHLANTGSLPGQLAGEDVKAATAWQHTTGDSAMVVAVIDDGVDVDHPNLLGNIAQNPDPAEPRDLCGRDFFLADDDPGHFDPRPKIFEAPFDELAGNDNHGTACAGVIASLGAVGGSVGIAPSVKILPVKVFHASSLAGDARIADAIRYAAAVSDVISCSWTGPASPDVEMAIEDARNLGRGRLGSPIFCASGNDGGLPVAFPASHPETIAVGASCDDGTRALYSNLGPELSMVAPSSGGVAEIFTTDISTPGRGFNPGEESQGGNDGLHTNQFGGTSSAAPLAAGVAALALSVNPDLNRKELQEHLEQTADKIGSGYDEKGHSEEFGFGRVNAARAVEETPVVTE